MMIETRASEEVGRLQYALDVSGTLLSLLCAAHCLVLPILLSWLSVQATHTEWLHHVLLVAVIPIVVFALGRGYQRHRRVGVLWLGALGLGCLLFGAIWGHALHLEAAATVVGSVFLIVAHAYNILSSRYHCQCCEVE